MTQGVILVRDGPVVHRPVPQELGGLPHRLLGGEELRGDGRLVRGQHAARRERVEADPALLLGHLAATGVRRALLDHRGLAGQAGPADAATRRQAQDQLADTRVVHPAAEGLRDGAVIDGLVAALALRRGRHGLDLQVELILDGLLDALPRLAQGGAALGRAAEQAGEVEHGARQIPLALARLTPHLGAGVRRPGLAQLGGDLLEPAVHLAARRGRLELLGTLLLVGGQDALQRLHLAGEVEEVLADERRLAEEGVEPGGAAGLREGASVLGVERELGHAERLLGEVTGHLVEALGGLVEAAHRVELGQHRLQAEDHLLVLLAGGLDRGVAAVSLDRVGLLQRGDHGGHLLAAQAVEHAVHLGEHLLLGRLLQPVVLQDADHRLDAPRHAVRLGLDGPLLGLLLLQALRLGERGR